MKESTETNRRHPILRKRKKRSVPLSGLGMSETVRVVSESPRRLEELLLMLENRDRRMRDRAAATLAWFVSLHPSKLLRFLPRIRVSLQDESAYVRWHLVYTVGSLCSPFPKRLHDVLSDLLERLEDENKIVRIMASKALARTASRNPRVVEELFRNIDREAPGIVVDVLRSSGSKAKSRKK